MRIKKIEIKGFGKLHDFTYKPSDGLNLIFGANESGKSTLQAFIRAMFFGLKQRKRKNEIDQIKRFKPWGEYKFGGSIEYSLDNGDVYRIERDFDKNIVHVFDKNGKKIDDDFESDKQGGLNIGKKHLGMNAEVFEKTAFVEQAKVKLDKMGNQDLHNRLLNVFQTGHEDISIDGSVEKLNRVRRESLGEQSDQHKMITVIDKEIDEVKKSIIKLKRNREKLFDAESSLKKLYNTKKEYDERAKQIYEEKNIELLSKRARIIEKLNNELKGAINEKKLLEVEKEELIKKTNEVIENETEINRLIELKDHQVKWLQQNNHFLIPFVIMLVLASIIGVVSFAMDKAFLLFIAIPFLIAALVLLFLDLVKNSRRDRKISAINAEMAELFRQNLLSPKTELKALLAIQKRIEESKQSENRIEGINIKVDKLSQTINETLASIKLTSEENIESSEMVDEYLERIELLKKNSIKDIKVKKSKSSGEENLFEELDNIKAEIIKNEVIVSNSDESHDDLQRLNEKLQELNEQKIRLLELDEALAFSIKMLRETSKEFENTYTPKLNKEISRIIRHMTNERYSKIESSDSMDIMPLSKEAGGTIDVLNLSQGTIEQMYLALRLATVFIMSEANEHLPMFMDEVFAYADEKRTIDALYLLKKESKRFQMFFVTCKKTEASIVKTILKEEVNILQLKV